MYANTPIAITIQMTYGDFLFPSIQCTTLGETLTPEQSYEQCGSASNNGYIGMDSLYLNMHS